jgi:hypothetical protein
MKIVVTITDAGGVVHAGASIEARSAIIEIPDEKLPNIVEKYLECRKWVSEAPNRHTYEYMTFSILDEEATNESK